jgi:mono/diheme cytochrome c family protein
VAFGVLLCLIPACQQEMAVQPSIRPDDPSTFFADGRAARPAIPGTIARGHLRLDAQLFHGRQRREERVHFPGALVGAGSGNPLAALTVAAAGEARGRETESDSFPFPVTERVLTHGKKRYMIYCIVCHDPLGTGRGMIVQRGYTPPPSLHIERLQKEPPGHFFQVITKGYGSMPSYGKQIPPADRWAIAAYIRALQLSQHFPEKDLTDAMRRERQEHGDGVPVGGAK